MAFFKETTRFFKGVSASQKLFKRQTDIMSGSTNESGYCDCIELYNIRGGLHDGQSWPFPDQCGYDCVPRGLIIG